MDEGSGQQALAPAVPAERFGGDGAFVQGDGHDEASTSMRMPRVIGL
jgi:hypothetical protein